MTGMEMMLAKLLGVTPEQMRETIDNAVNLLGNIDRNLKQMTRQIDEMHAAMFARGPHIIEGHVIEGNKDAEAA